MNSNKSIMFDETFEEKLLFNEEFLENDTFNRANRNVYTSI